jgi:ABC-type nitrate/sulfonate/bicarbonate transport system substrate-binding protein
MPRVVGLALEWLANVNHTPIFVAVERGYIREEDLKLEILEPVTHEAGLELVASGKLDFAVAEPIRLPEVVSRGLRVKAFGKYFTAGFGVMAVEKIKSPRDFKGIRIAAPLSRYARTIIRSMASSSGASISEKDFEVIQVGYYLTDALLEGRAEAAFAVYESYEVVEAEHRGLRVNFFRFTDYGVPVAGHLVFVARTETIGRDPSTPIRFLKSVRRGVEATVRDPEAAFKTLVSYVPALNDELNKKLFKAALRCFTTSMLLDPQEWARLAGYAYEAGLVGRKLDPADLIDTSVARLV